MNFDHLTPQDACNILATLDEGSALPEATRERLETLRKFRQRELDVLENYRRGEKNVELCQRWNASQTVIGGIARKLGL